MRHRAVISAFVSAVVLVLVVSGVVAAGLASPFQLVASVGSLALVGAFVSLLDLPTMTVVDRPGPDRRHD